MIDLNIGKTFNQEPSQVFSFSSMANMPHIKATNVLLSDLEYYFNSITEQFNIIDKNNTDVKIIEPAEEYIKWHGLNRAAVESFGPSLESIGIEVDPGDYKKTLDVMIDHLEDAKYSSLEALKNITELHKTCDVVERWCSVMDILNKKALASVKTASKASFKLDTKNKVVGVTPSTFEHQAKQVVVLTAMFNSKDMLDLNVVPTLQVQHAISSLENIEYRCDSVLNLSWTTEEVKRLGDYVKNYMIPNTLKFTNLVSKLQQGCYDIINQYNITKCDNLKALSFAAYRAAEVSARLVTQYTDMVK